MTATAATSQCERQGGFTKKVGSTLYKVNVYYSKASREPLENKILRMIKNDLNFEPKSDTMASLQTGRLPERSSL